MKKILLILLVLLFTQSARADFIPQYTTSVKHWGIGGVFVSHEFTIQEAPNEHSEVIRKVKWEDSGDVTCWGQCNNNQIFVAFYPAKNYAILAADDENEGWAQVYYDQETGDMGWVKIRDDKDEKFISWVNFIRLYGKAHGYYLFKDIKKEERRLYAQPEDGSQSVDSWEVAKNITPWYIKGNWLMAKVLNFDSTIKTGWLKWRTEDGQLRGFVNLKN